MNAIEKIICIILVGVLFFVLFCQTLFRNIGLNAFWTDESARYLFALLTYVGAGLATLMGKQIKIEILIYIWPKKIRPYIELIGSIISVIFCLYVTYATLDYNINVVLAGGRLSASLQIPIAIPYMSVTIGYALMAIRGIQAEVIPYFKPSYSILWSMSLFLNVGMPLKDILKSVTYTPAKAFGILDRAGTLDMGKPADVAILKVIDKKQTYADLYNKQITGDKLILPMATIREGNMVFQQIFMDDELS